MRDFAYFGEIDFPLGDEIAVFDSQDELKDEFFLVSNDKGLKAEIYANEIDFYLKNSADDALNKASGVSILYAARAVAFDEGEQQTFSKQTGKNVLIIGTDKRAGELKAKLENSGFKAICLESINFIYGCAGELSVIIDEGEVECDFALFFAPEPYALRQSGCLDISVLSDEQILEFLLSHSPEFQYKNWISYDESACLYKARRHEICGSCADVCPSVAIMKNDEIKELEFSHIDCVACGRCVSVCPSAAIKSAVLPRSAFNKISRLYKKFVPLVLSGSQKAPQIKLSKGVLPLVIPALNMLDCDYLLSLVLGSSGQVILHLPSIDESGLNAINLVNEICKRAFGSEMIFYSNSDEKLQKILEFHFKKDLGLDDFIDFGTKPELLANKLEIIAKSVEFKGLNDLELQNSIAHGKIEINADICTLCSACVAACNTGALTADTATNAICFNESLCVGCNYCALSCAESGAMSLSCGKVSLNEEFFKPKELVRDELFACVECGKEFATKKSIERIKNMMEPIFGADEFKKRSLLCCADCKAKLALEAQLKGNEI